MLMDQSIISGNSPKKESPLNLLNHTQNFNFKPRNFFPKRSQVYLSSQHLFYISKRVIAQDQQQFNHLDITLPISIKNDIQFRNKGPQPKRSQTIVMPSQRTSNHNDEVSRERENQNGLLVYRKYILKNKQKDKVKPFYMWKDGFIENYKKYCTQQQVGSRFKAEEQLIDVKNHQNSLNQSILEGYFDVRQVEIKADETKITNNSKIPENVLKQDYDPLKTSLFNQKDAINSIKKYFYDNKGAIQFVGRKKKMVGVKNYIENLEKDLQILSLTEVYGIHAHEILNQQEQNFTPQMGNLNQDGKNINVENNQKLRISVDYTKQSFDTDIKYYTSTNQKAHLTRRFNNSDFISLNNTQVTKNKPQPLNAVTIYLNTHSQDGNFECKLFMMKVEQLRQQNNHSFLEYCQQKFQTSNKLKFIFAQDGTPIHQIGEFMLKNPCSEIFVSSYPYFIGRKDYNEQTFETIDNNINNFTIEDSLIYPLDLSIDYNSQKNVSSIFKSLKKRQKTPSLLAKPNELKPQFSISLPRSHNKPEILSNRFQTQRSPHNVSQVQKPQQENLLTKIKHKTINYQQNDTPKIISFNDYMHSVLQEQEFTNQQYSTFYKDAAKRHRDQMLNQLSFNKHLQEIKAQSQMTSYTIGNLNEGNVKESESPNLQISKLVKHKIMIETAKIIEKSFLMINSLCNINKEAMYVSLLSSWYMKYKNKEQIFESNKYIEIENQIFEVIKQITFLNQKKYYSFVTEELLLIKKDLKALIQDQFHLSQGQSRNQVLKSIFQDTENNINSQDSLTRIPQSINIVIANQSQKQLNQEMKSQRDNYNKSKSSNSNNSHDQRMKTADDSKYQKFVIDEQKYDSMFKELSTNIFSQEETIFIEQTFKIIVQSIGSTNSMNLNIFELIAQESKIQSKESYEIKQRFAKNKKKVPQDQFILVIQQIRYERILREIHKIIILHQKIKFTKESLKPIAGIPQSKTLIITIFENILQIPIKLDLFFQLIINELNQEEQSNAANNVLNSHLELIIILLLMLI